MEYIYKIKKREFITKYKNGAEKKVHLTRNEHLFLILICVNEAVKIEDLAKAIYNVYDKYSHTCIRMIKYKIVNKTNLLIKSIKYTNAGELLLEDKVQIM